MAITKQDIWNVADQLNEKGEKPTLAAIRKAVGSGSYTTISEAMKEWRDNQQSAESTPTEPVPESIKQALLDMGSELWQQTVAHADSRWRIEREELEERITSLEQQLAESGELADTLSDEAERAKTLQADVERLDKAVSTLEDGKARLESQLAGAQEEIKEAREESRTHQEAATTAQHELVSLKSQHKQAREEKSVTDAENKKLNGEVAKLTALLDQHATQAKELQEEIKRLQHIESESAAKDQKIENLESQLGDAKKEVTELRSITTKAQEKAASAQGQSDLLSKQVKSLENKLARMEKSAAAKKPAARKTTKATTPKTGEQSESEDDK